MYKIKSHICASEDDSGRMTSQQSFYCKFDFVSERKCDDVNLNVRRDSHGSSSSECSVQTFFILHVPI